MAEEANRMCVNCGKTVPSSHNRFEPLPECVDPETGLSACTFDMTSQEAADHWCKEAHRLRAEVRRLQAENERLREGLEHYATNRHWHWNPDRGVWEYNASGSAYYRGCPSLARSTDLPDQEAVDAECGSIARTVPGGREGGEMTARCGLITKSGAAITLNMEALRA